jgi:hypothetical protein
LKNIKLYFFIKKEKVCLKKINFKKIKSKAMKNKYDLMTKIQAMLSICHFNQYRGFLLTWKTDIILSG